MAKAAELIIATPDNDGGSAVLVRCHVLVRRGQLDTTPELQSASDSAMAPLTEAVTRAIGNGTFLPAEPTIIVISLWSTVHGLAQLLLAGLVPAEADPARAAMATLDGWRTGGTPISPRR